MGNTTGGIRGRWTLDSYVAHNEAMHRADSRFHAERDRRYTEVKIETEKALKIKEVADLAALSLASEIQKYKDEKANALRKQIEDERGAYPTRAELAAVDAKHDANLKAATSEIKVELRPVIEYITAQRGGTKRSDRMIAFVFGGIATLASGVAIILSLRPRG